MKLKSVVASMLALGVASGVAMAASNSTVSRTEFDAMKDQVAQMEAALQQNQGSSNVQATNDWFNRITISGQFDVDGFWSAAKIHGMNSDDRTESGIELPNANIFIDAKVNDWVKVHSAIHFYTQVQRDALDGLRSASNNGLIDQAYVTIANFAQSPLYLRAGRQYLPFGDYNPYNMVPSLAQHLTQTHESAAVQAGFVTANGLNGAVYTYQGTRKAKNENKTRINNFGANLGFASSYNNVSYKASIGYIYNMADVDFISNGLYYYDTTERVAGGISVDASVKSGAIDASGHYVTALRDFHDNDHIFTSKDIKPSAWGIDAGYSFDTAGHNSRFGLGYQRTSDASEVGPIYYSLPKERYIGSYTVNVLQNTDLGLSVYHDRDYKVADGNRDKETTGLLSLSVKFA